MVHKQNKFYYRLTQFLSGIVSHTLFRRRVLRNELKGKKGPLVVIANHEAALDFTNLIGLTKEEMIFVISNSFYNSLPFKKIMDKIGVIPKQQFQTCVKDMCAMKSAVEHGKILVIYPAGLMCEDGLSTPIPHTTYQFLKWIKADIYMARITGTYFVTPKWSKKNRPGRTYIDVFKLFDKAELENMELEEIVKRTNEHLLFDAYRDQEEKHNAITVKAFVPLSEMFGYATDLRSKTQGRGQYVMEPDGYKEVPKSISESIISERSKRD